MKKKLLIGAATAIVGFSSVAGLGVASAASQTNDQQPTLIDKIAQKFNLNKDEVKAVFDADRSEHQAARQTKQKEALAQAVKDGKLTQDQADKITAKRAEMQTFMESLKDKTEADRKSAMDAKRDELKKWARENNIPEQYVHGPGMGRGHGGPGGPEGKAKPSQTN